MKGRAESRRERVPWEVCTWLMDTICWLEISGYVNVDEFRIVTPNIYVVVGFTFYDGPPLFLTASRYCPTALTVYSSKLLYLKSKTLSTLPPTTLHISVTVDPFNDSILCSTALENRRRTISFAPFHRIPFRPPALRTNSWIAIKFRSIRGKHY